MLSNKLSSITPSYTIGISSKVKELESKGIEIINLSIGEPDFYTPVLAKQTGIEAINSNKTKYDLVSGLRDLRNLIKEKLKKENNIDYNIDEIVVSNGAKHSISNTLLALINPGDEVIIPKPYWVSYPEMVKLVYGIPVFVDTKKENNFKLTPDVLEKKITSKTKILILSNPSNPTGAVYTRQQLEALVEVCISHGIYIISDEIYERICYSDKFVSTASLSDKAKEITITINGLSKSAAMTGWRIGYSASNEKIAKAISTIQGHLVSHPSTISQWAAYGALAYSKKEMEEMVKVYKDRRNIAIDILNQSSNLSIIKPDGAFYIFIDISKIKDSFHCDNLSIEFCNYLLDKYKVAVVPGIAFGMDDYIRISYACDIDSLREGLNRLIEAVDKLFV